MSFALLRSVLFVMSVGSLLALAGCGSDETPSAANGSGGTELADREFWSTSVTELGEPRALAEGTKVSLRFGSLSNGEWPLNAGAGCNSISGAVSIVDGRLQVAGDGFFQTEMGCGPELHAQDELLLGLLAGKPDVVVVGDNLTIRSADVTVELIDATVANPVRSIYGTIWEIDGFVRMPVAMSMATTSAAWLIFDEDGTFAGGDGCNLIEGQIAVDGDQIRFVNVVRIDAGDCTQRAYADEVHLSLLPIMAWTVDGDRLEMTDVGGIGFTARATAQ